MQEQKDTVTIRVNVPSYIHEDLTSISKNIGIPMTEILRPRIKLIGEHSDMIMCHYQQDKGKSSEIRITEVPVFVKAVIRKNAKGFNLTETAYLKCWLSQIAASFPPHLKRTPRVY